MAVSSLGFRGEALASIAAVSQVELITKTADSLSGVRYTIDGGVPGEVAEIGAPEGTTFIVRNIFYNTRKSVKEKGLPALYNSVTYSIPSKLTKPPASRMD